MIWLAEYKQAVIPWDGFFNPILTQISDFLMSHHYIPHFDFEKRVPKVPVYSEKTCVR